MKIFTNQSKENKKTQKNIHHHQHHYYHHHHSSDSSHHHVPSSFGWIKNWWYRQIYQPPLWCFRIVQNEINDNAPSSSLWKPFSRYNQKMIWEAAREHLECQIQDPLIYNGKEVIRIIVQEEIAFVFNPEWSHPIIYDIALLPVPPIWTWKYYRKNEKQKQNQT